MSHDSLARRPATDVTDKNADAAAKDLLKTGIFGAVAATCLVITLIVHFMSGPKDIEEFGQVGEEFYPKFVDASKAKALDVYAVSGDGRAQTFRVAQEDSGRWVIPSHHDYPADAEEQLADTAASVIGLIRGALVTRWKDDHGKYGVMNPKEETLAASDVDGVGKRISLEDEKGKVLVDFIVGKKVEDKQNEYYVRHPSEDEVYVTNLDINLTTKFTDWIESTLFDIQSTNVVNLTTNDYSFEETNGGLTLSKSEVTAISRPKSTDSWTTGGLDEEKDEINTKAVDDVITAVSSLAVAGVRPKQPGLTPNFQLDRNRVKSERDFSALNIDLMQRGFILQPSRDGDPDALELLAREGELTVGTNDGLVYVMYFGRVFTGSTEELEIGFGKDDKEPAEDKGAEDTDGDDDKDDEPGEDSADDVEGDEEKDSGKQPGRYVFVRVAFDKQYLGEEPTQPTEPETPAELKDAAPPKEGEEDPLKDVRAAFQDAQFKYQNDKRLYDEFVKKVADGIEKSEKLNVRFAEWYYVVSGEAYNKLKLTRAEYVQEKKADAPGPGGPGGLGGGLPPNFPQIPGLSPPSDPTDPPEGDKAPNPAVPTPEGDKAPNPAVPTPEADQPADPAPPNPTPETPTPEGDQPAP